jgi:hypothetical protein
VRPTRRVWFGVLIALVALAAFGCDEGGIGMGVPTSGGARWGTGGSGPGVIVGGGPVYR